MAGHASSHAGEEPCDVVRFYLFDHRTPVGKAIDVGLLALNLLFVAVFVAETYPVIERVRAGLWSLVGSHLPRVPHGVPAPALRGA